MANINKFSKDLVNEILNSEQIFLLPHIYADIDTLSSCFAMGEILKKLNKKAYIIFGDDINKIDDSAKLIISCISNYIEFISPNDLEKKRSDKDLFITLDVNKKDLISIKDFKDTDTIIVIDHHNIDKNTLKAKYKYIDLTASSASEIIFNLYNCMDFNYNEILSNCLLAGIYLDTNKLYNINNYKTFIAVSELIKNGADLRAVQKLFIGNFDNDRKVHNLINKKEDLINNIAICIADDDIFYTRAELAKSADYLIKFGYDAVFVVGYIEKNLISISARSNGNINVCNIMRKFDGGGTFTSSAARIENSNLNDIKDKIIKIVKKGIVREYEKRY